MVLLSYTSMAGVHPSISRGELPFQAVSLWEDTRFLAEGNGAKERGLNDSCEL